MTIDVLIIVLAWTAVTGIGLAASLWNRADAKLDLAELPMEVQNGRRRYGEGWVRRETIRAWHQGIGFALGLGALLQVPLPAVLGLLAMATLVMLNTIIDYRDRRAINKALGVRK